MPATPVAKGGTACRGHFTSGHRALQQAVMLKERKVVASAEAPAPSLCHTRASHRHPMCWWCCSSRRLFFCSKKSKLDQRVPDVFAHSSPSALPWRYSVCGHLILQQYHLSFFSPISYESASPATLHPFPTRHQTYTKSKFKPW